MQESENQQITRTFIANLKHAINQREIVFIGGGEFTTEELKALLSFILSKA